MIELGMTEQTLTDPDDPRGDEDVWRTCERVLEATSYVPGNGGISYPEFLDLVRRALLELYRRASARLNDDYAKPYFDHLFAQNDLTGKSVSTVTFGGLCKEYLDAFREEAKFKNVDQKRIDKVAAHVKLVEKIIGPATLVTQIDYDACVSFRKTLAKIPKNMHKHYGDIPADEAAAAASEHERPTMAYSTQKGYLRTLTAVLKLASKKGLIGSVPSADLTPHAENIPDEDKRKPFTTDQLKAIFSAPLYTGCQDDGMNFSKPGPSVIRRARFWVPLILLFTGMRPNEVCQLYVEDVKVSGSGIDYFDIDLPPRFVPLTMLVCSGFV
jgi:hypothetical protein